MATTRVKDISSTATSLASDDYIAVDGATNGTRKMVRGSIYTDVAAAFTGAPTTYDICPLNSGTNKIDATYLPTSGDTPKGEWNANTNSPALADGAGTAGDYYDVTTAGTQNLGSGNITFTVGDVVKYDGATWYKIDSVANFLDGYSTAATSRTALEVNSVDEDAEAIGTKLLGPSIYFDGSNDYIEVADDAKLSFTDGTDDLPFSVGGWVNMSDATTFCVAGKYGTTAAAREWLLQVASDDKLRLTVIDTSGNACRIDYDTALTSYEGQWVHVAASYSGAGLSSGNAFSVAGNGMSLFVNGVDVTASSTVTNSASYSGMSDTSQAVWLGRLSNSYSKGHIRNVSIYNRELSSSEIADLARGNELGFSDQYAGALGGTYTSDFSAGVDGWTANNGTAAGNVDTIGGQDDNLRLTLDATNNVHQLQKASILTAGKRYRVSLDYYIPSGQSNVDGLRILAYDGSGNTSLATEDTATLDAWTRLSGEMTDAQLGKDGIRVAATDGGATTFQDAGGDDVLYIRNVKVTEIGTLADFRSERFGVSEGKWYDLSDNAFVGTNSGATLVGREVPVYETGTWTPVLTFGGGSTGITYTSQEGYYTRIGNTVTATGGFILSAKGSSTGSAAISLPLTARNTTDDVQGFSVGRGLNMAGLTSAVSGYIVDNTTSARLMDWGATGAVDLDEANFTNTTEINMTVTYQIA